MKNKRKQNHTFYRDLQQAAACDIKNAIFFGLFLGVQSFFFDPFEKLNSEVWVSTLQSIASQTRRRARPRPLRPIQFVYMARKRAENRLGSQDETRLLSDRAGF